MRRSIAFLSAIFCAAQFVAGPPLAQAQPKPPGPPSKPDLSPPQVQAPAPPKPESFFGNLNKLVIAHAGELEGWRKDAESAGSQLATDFLGCPSQAAQTLYDKLGGQRQDAISARNAAEAADKDAVKARQRCLDTPGIPAASCHTAYNNLPFVAQRASAQAAVDAIDGARKALKALRCPAGCDKPLSLRVTDATLGQGDPISPRLTVCTAWDPGKLLARAGVAGDELSAEFKARLPRCSAHQTVVPRYCKRWDAAKLLLELKTLKLLPPAFDAGRLSVTVPTAQLEVVTGMANQCRRTETVCTQVKGEATITVDSADPVATLAQISGSRCARRSPLGCSDPPLGLQPTMAKVEVPLTTKAKLTWASSDGASRIDVQLPEQGFVWVQAPPGAPVPTPIPEVKASGNLPRPIQRPGSIEFDFTKPSLRAACQAWADIAIPTTRVAYTQRTVAAPLCTSPRLGPVVARP